MIVMKFGGTSIADASRILGAAEIVRGRAGARPVVVVSALAGVTDLLVRAIIAAREGDRDALEPILADLVRRHRWAIAGAVEPAGARHDLDLEIDALFEDLRQLLRSVRVLGEGTPRSSDTLLAFGEDLSSRIVTAIFRSAGLPARRVEARDLIVTDDRHGAASPDLPAVTAAARRSLLPILDAGEIPVIAGFVGATPRAHTTTLGRGGSDTSAATLGAALGAAEIQIWTDVDGILSADPRMVPHARVRPRVTFAEAAELTYYGARVLHPASVEPAVRMGIPVRVLNTLRPEGEGTTILASPADDAPPLVSVASRAGVAAVRVTSRRMKFDPGFLPRVLEGLEACGGTADLVAASEVGVVLVVSESVELAPLRDRIGEEADVEALPDRAVVCVVGSGMAAAPAVRAHVLATIALHEPDVVVLGSSATSAAAIWPASRVADVVRGLHRAFFEEAVA